MQFDKVLLEKLIEIKDSGSKRFVLHFDGKLYPLSDVIITKSSPVVKFTSSEKPNDAKFPTVRISASSFDSSLAPLLSKAMLGPNTEFEELVIKAKGKINSESIEITLLANLISRMQSGSKMILNLVVTGTS